MKVERKKVASRGDIVDDKIGQALVEAGVDVVRVRSATTCEAEYGVCRLCYGWSLATGRLVDIGESVGIVAAQSIGEPGTQLTMRTFHTGGVAGEDITHGLPRVVELFEARKPKGEALITELPGTVTVEDDEEKKVRWITVTSEDGELVQYPVSFRQRLLVGDGDTVVVGQQLLEGSVNLIEKLRIEGVQALQGHLVEEVQQVYRSQGVTIHDKHIELIVRQMLRKVQIIEPGDTEFLPGDLVDRRRFEAANRETVDGGGQPASARPQLLDHEGVVRHRLVAVGGLVPGDHPRADRGGDRRQVGRPARAQGERDHRQADPGRHGHVPVPERAGPHQARGDPGVLARFASARSPRRRRPASRSWRGCRARRPSVSCSAGSFASRGVTGPGPSRSSLLGFR